MWKLNFLNMCMPRSCTITKTFRSAFNNKINVAYCYLKYGSRRCIESAGRIDKS